MKFSLIENLLSYNFLPDPSNVLYLDRDIKKIFLEEFLVFMEREKSNLCNFKLVWSKLVLKYLTWSLYKDIYTFCKFKKEDDVFFNTLNEENKKFINTYISSVDNKIEFC